ncbi:MAG TPA: hypothetical protein V6C58_24615 [Allocoleopsis sp.]
MSKFKVLDNESFCRVALDDYIKRLGINDEEGRMTVDCEIFYFDQSFFITQVDQVYYGHWLKDGCIYKSQEINSKLLKD